MNRIEKLREYIDEILLNMNDIEERRHAYMHLYGVSQACALIALKRNQHVELATMAGMLHDLYAYKTGIRKNHAENGAILAREILEELNLTSKEETELICSAIRNHSSKKKKHSAFDEVLIDADVLQHRLYNVDLPPIEKEIKRYDALIEEFGISI